jgi:hypothetical protein
MYQTIWSVTTPGLELVLKILLHLPVFVFQSKIVCDLFSGSIIKT